MDFDSHINGVVLAAVALVNAVTPGMRGGRPVEVPDDLVTAVADALHPTHRHDLPPHPADATALAAWAPRLRTVLELVEERRVDDACTRLNELLRDTHAVPTLARHDGQAWHLHFHGPHASFADGWTAGMATALAVVLGNPAIDRLGVCTAEACDRVYADSSRNGTRRFCSTACQNRVKAAAFRVRRAGAAAG